MKFVLAPTVKMEALEKQVDVLLEAIAKVLDEPSLTGALVTDESIVSDLSCTVVDCLRVSELLGVEVTRSSFLWSVAHKMMLKEDGDFLE